jgi:hypothetical protein
MSIQNKTRTLHIEQLIKAGAAADGLKFFREAFGDQVTITPDFCARHAKEMNFHWFAARLLSADGYAAWLAIDEMAMPSIETVSPHPWREYGDVPEEDRVAQLWEDYETLMARSFGELYVRE